MKRYWDTSALVNALHNADLKQKVLEPDQWTRPHSLAEAFSTLTGGRLGFKYSPDDAAALLKDLTAGMHFIELDKKDTFSALDLAKKKGIRGGRIHDWMHCRAAAKSGAAFLITDNHAHFTGLEDGFKLATSEDLLSS
jgi:hypothetical protein